MSDDIFEVENIEETINETVVDPTTQDYAASQPAPVGPQDGGLTEDEVTEVSEEIDLQEKYGNSAVRAAAEAGASSLTFGISDQIISKWGGDEARKALRERRERNEGAATLGEIAGIVAPLALSGGSSLLAKGVTGAGLGLKGVAGAGKAVEKLTVKGLNKLIAESGKKQAAKEVLKKGIAKGSGSAVEGTFFGVGELIEENALGKADMNAENLLAYGGEGALWGGILGAGLGTSGVALGKTAEVVSPIIKNNQITNFVVKKIKNFKDEFWSPVYNAWHLSGKKHTAIVDIMEKNPKVADHLPKVIGSLLKKEGNLGALTSRKKLYKDTLKYIDDTGEKIGNTLHEIQFKYGDNVYMFPTKADLARSIVSKLDDLKVKRGLLDAEGLPKKTEDAVLELKKINELQKKYMDDFFDRRPLNATELQKEKVDFFKRSKWDYTGDKLPITASINRTIGEAFKDELYATSHKISPALGKQLRNEFLDYQTATTFVSGFGKKVDAMPEGDWGQAKDLFLTMFLAGSVDLLGPVSMGLMLKAYAKSDLKNKMAILSSIEKANIKVEKKVKKSLSDYFNLKSISEGVVPVSTTLLIDSPLAKPLDVYTDNEFKDGIEYTKKPKTDDEALINITKNIDNLKANPNLLNGIASNMNFQASAPETYKHSQSILIKSLAFLDSKLPAHLLTVDVNPFFKKHYSLSEQEIYKFKKYLRAIQKPMSILEDLQRGTLSRESVEAVKFVYPNLYEKIHSTVYDELSKKGREGKPEYKQRLQLNILMGIPTDTALVPEYLMEHQQLYKEAKDAQAGGTISATAANRMDIAQSQATELEQVSNRRDLRR